MDSRTVHEKQWSFAEDYSAAYSELQKKDLELGVLMAKKKEKKQVLETLQKRIEELNKKAEELCHEISVKHEEICRVTEIAEEEKRKEDLKKYAEIKRLKEEYVELMGRNQEIQRQVQSHRVYPDFMERAAKISKFDSAERLADHLESLLILREKLYQREEKAEEQVTQQRTTLRTLEDRYHSLQLQMNNQLSQLDKELKNTLSETQAWESKWIHIVKTATKENLLWGQMKMATLNLYDMTNASVKEEEAVDVNDTETQLDKIMTFIEDHEDILKWHQSSTEKQRRTAKKGTGKKQGQKCKATEKD